MNTYKVWLTIKCDNSPRKWLPETVESALYGDEDIIDWEVELQEDD